MREIEKKNRERETWKEKRRDRYFGKDTAPYCKDIEASIELFDTFKAESEFHPNWGKERAEQVSADCE